MSARLGHHAAARQVALAAAARATTAGKASLADLADPAEQLVKEAAFAAKRVGRRTSVRLPHRFALLALLLLLLRQGFAQVAHPFAQRFHRLGLVVQRTGKVIFAQRALGTIHRAACPVKRVAGGLALLAADTREGSFLTTQLFAQSLLTVR